MNFNEYQKLVMRTCCITEDKDKMIEHALFGLCSEAGEVAAFVQKKHQGHEMDMDHLKKELGDCMWMIAEAYTAVGKNMSIAKDYYYPDNGRSLETYIGRLCMHAGRTMLYAGPPSTNIYRINELCSSLSFCCFAIERVCSICGFTIDDVLETNIAKLRARYPEGFTAERSLHRAEGDI